jgi:arylsulfatase A-like enzyme/ankyrin repeat protein
MLHVSALASVVLAVSTVRPIRSGQAPVAAPSVASPAQAAPAHRPRSVLFYLEDTCRGDRPTFDGYERDTTPFLARLAEHAVVFEDCTSQAAWTKPSMASLLTSQYPSTTGIYRMTDRLADEALTWPEVLHAHGLYTAGFSANVVMGNLLSNFAQGFDHFVESTEINGGDPIRFASGSARKLNEHAFGWLDKNDSWPMLLYMHSVDPHEEYEPEPQYLQRFADPARHEQFRREWKQLLESRPPIPGLYVTQGDFDRTGIDAASFIAYGSSLYDADILANDDQLARLWEKLQQDGWGDDFVFVFTSDHGEEFFEHGGTCHGYGLYQETLHVPLMIYAPGLLPQGKRIKAPVRSVDVFPTLCELLGIPVPDGLEGKSLLPLVRGEPTATPAILSEHREDPLARRMGQGSGKMVAVRSGNWKLVLNVLGSQMLDKPRVELYDLAADPGETHDVAAAHPEVVREFEAQALSFAGRQWKDSELGETAEVAPEVLAQLRALGYVGTEDDVPDLWKAIDAHDLDAVRRSLKAGAAPDQLEKVLGVSPLAMAAMGGDLALAQLLLDSGAKVDVRNKDGATPLHGAAFLGRVELLELWLNHGAAPDTRSASGDTPLTSARAPWDITAAIAGILKVPVERKAIEAGRAECIEILTMLQSTDASTERLFAAVRAGDLAACTAALTSAASPTHREASTGWTALHLAAFLGQVDIARLLLTKGATVETRAADGASALHLGALGGSVATLELLFEHHADVAARDDKGATPLHFAAFLGRADATRWLLEKGAEANAKDASGHTPLDATTTDWQVTEHVLGLLGLHLERAEVEANRARVVELLRR